MSTFPQSQFQEAGNISWNGMGEYATIGGGPRLKPVQYKNLIDVLNRLAVIDPQLMARWGLGGHHSLRQGAHCSQRRI